MAVSNYTIDEKVEAVKKFVKAFWPERYFHLALMILCFLIILVLAIVLFTDNRLPWTSFLALFLPSGVLSYLSSKVLSMFTSCLELLKGEIK
jgi:hypothetical protein